MNADIRAEILRRKPYLERYFRSAESGASASLRLETARTGESIMVRIESGRAHPLASRYEPRREAERMLPPPHARWSASQIVLVLGLGNPLALLDLLPRLLPNQICVAIDASEETGRLLCREYPRFEEFLLRPGCHLFCGSDSLGRLEQYIEALPAEGLSGVRFLRHPASGRLAPEFYADIEARLRNILRARMSDLLTRFQFEQIWLRNIIINSRLLPPERAKLPAATCGAFQNALAGVPGVLISTGPSLSESLPLLQRLKSRAFLLACDASLKPLQRAGIDPHAVITLDAQQHTLFHFLGEPGLARCLLFADLVANPDALRRLHPRALIFSTTAKVQYGADGALQREETPGAEHAERIHGPVGALQSGGSVATSAFDLLRNLGCDPILLVGQDLAYTDRKIHSVGAHHYERWRAGLRRTRSMETIIEQIVRRRSTFPLPALEGGETLGDYVLNLYRQWFEESAGAVAGRLINLTARGATLAGFERPADALAFAESLPEIDDPLERFRAAQPPQEYAHPENRALYEAAARAAGGDPDAREALFAEFPYLARLTRRAEVYLKRNREKLGPERALRLYERNATEALAAFERALRPYFRD